MNHRTATLASTLTRGAAAALLTLTAATAAQAVPVSVSLGGLPAGLSPSVTIKRNICMDGIGWINNAKLTLTESTATTLERVVLPDGRVVMRGRLVPTYVGSIDTPATPVQNRCSTHSIGPDELHLILNVPGADDTGTARVLSGSLGVFAMHNPVVVNAALAARTTSLVVVNQPQGTLARGMVHSVQVGFSASLGTVELASLTMTRQSPTNPLLWPLVARLFERADGRACIQTSSSTRCLGDTPGPLVHGGVQLHGIPVLQGIKTFQFTLQQNFVVGPMRIRASANATDLDNYLVDGSLEPLDLLPWKTMSLATTVQ